MTNDNLSNCKEIMNMVDEVRHLDGIKGNFMISESEYLAPITSRDKIKPADTIIFSNVKEIVEHQQYVFHTFWDKAIPAEQKIREIEEGIVHYDTRIINDSQQIIKEINCLIADSNELYSCLTTGPSTAPGKIALTRIFDSPSSIDSVLVRPMRPHFVVAYGLRSG